MLVKPEPGGLDLAEGRRCSRKAASPHPVAIAWREKRTRTVVSRDTASLPPEVDRSYVKGYDDGVAVASVSCALPKLSRHILHRPWSLRWLARQLVQDDGLVEYEVRFPMRASISELAVSLGWPHTTVEPIASGEAANPATTARPTRKD